MAEPLIKAGAPIVIVMPGVVYGPGDTSLLGKIIRRFYVGKLPILPNPELTVTWAHVADIVEGHILAAEKGKIGESYILAGPSVPFGEMVDFWAYLTGLPTPAIKVPAKLLKLLAPIMPMFGRELIAGLDATYTARADKARDELGWQPRTPQDGFLETFEWLSQKYGSRQIEAKKYEKTIACVALGTAITLLFLWLRKRKRLK